MSVYTPGIPVSGASIPAQDRSLISDNFTQLNTQFSIDHVALTSAMNNGYHTNVHYLQQPSDAAAVASANVVYTKLANSVNELFMRRALGDGSSIIQMTSGNTKFVPGPLAIGGTISINSGETFLPGGFQIKFGRIQIPGSTGTVNYTTNAALDNFPNNTINVLMMPVLNSTTNINITATAATGFSFLVNGTPGSLLYFWLAIGY